MSLILSHSTIVFQLHCYGFAPAFSSFIGEKDIDWVISMMLSTFLSPDVNKPPFPHNFFHLTVWLCYQIQANIEAKHKKAENIFGLPLPNTKDVETRLTRETDMSFREITGSHPARTSTAGGLCSAPACGDSTSSCHPRGAVATLTRYCRCCTTPRRPCWATVTPTPGISSSWARSRTRRAAATDGCCSSI